jgi:adenosylcobinamide-phosphate synthase
MRQQAKHTLSPNAGYPMSAMAGALNVELEKSGHYRLGLGHPKPQSGDINRAIQVLFGLAGLLTALLCTAKFIPPSSDQ